MSAIRSLCAVALLAMTAPLAAATFTVTSSAGDGPGTLKQAILDANATAGRDAIRFAVPQATIEPSGLPPITDAVDIDGRLGDGSRVLIEMPAAFDVTGGFKFVAGSSTSTLANVIVGRPPNVIPNAALTIDPAVSQIAVTGSNFYGSWRIDGSEGAFDANTFLSRDFTVRVSGDHNDFTNNVLPRVSILFDAFNTLFAGNTIYVLDSAGSLLRVTNNTFAGPGNLTAISIEAGSATGSTLDSNTIHDYERGIGIRPSVTGIAIVANSIYSTGIPIDLGFDGPTPNDPAPDADGGANNLQNYPLLTSATLAGGVLVVTGSLTSAPLTTYGIELFADHEADPETRRRIWNFQVTTDAAGVATFTETITFGLPAANEAVTATASQQFTHDSSEVSAPVAILAPGTLTFSQVAYSVEEADGTALITVNRTGGSEGTVTVQYATQPGTATTPSDFATTSGTLTFAPGVTSQTFSVPIVVDGMPEDTEQFTMTLSNPTGGAVLGTANARVTIASHLAEAIPTASTWALLILAVSLALIALRRG